MCKINKNIQSTQTEIEIFKFRQSKKSVEYSFTAPDLSSNGGLLLLGEAEARCGFLGKFASLINEWRNEDLLVHDLRTLVKLRVMQIAAGFEDADDCDHLRNDKALKIQLTFFNNYYGEYCYMPLLAFDAATGRLILPMLRPGRVNKRLNVCGLMKRLVTKIRKRWPRTKIVVRGDGQFCSHHFMTWARKKNVMFITGMTANSVLYAKVANLVEHAAYLYKKEGKNVKLYTRFWYRASSWDTMQWVIAKVEHTDKGSNVRFIVTNLIYGTPKELYETGYCKRGVCELYIKELKTYLKADRMSCSSFLANQFRLFLHSAAYVLLLQAKQLLFSDTDLAEVSILTFRERVILSAVRITEMKTKIKVEFQNDHAMRTEMERAMRIAVGWQNDEAA